MRVYHPILGREYYTFQKYINLEFVPFGRAKSLDADGNEFECHHGPKECVSNIIHSCGIKYLKSQNARQQFVVCQMRLEADQTGKEVRELRALNHFVMIVMHWVKVFVVVGIFNIVFRRGRRRLDWGQQMYQWWRGQKVAIESRTRHQGNLKTAIGKCSNRCVQQCMYHQADKSQCYQCYCYFYRTLKIK